MNKEEEREIKITKEMKKTQATRIKNVFRKHKEFLRTQYETEPFKEPVMLLERRSGEIEFYENVTAGLFNYKHSDGSERFMIINTNDQKTFGHTKNKYRGYIAHEDHPTTGRQDPLITSEQMNIIVDKSLNDIKKWKATETRAKGDMWYKIAIGIALIIGALALKEMIAPSSSGETAVQVVKQVGSNVTILG